MKRTISTGLSSMLFAMGQALDEKHGVKIRVTDIDKAKRVFYEARKMSEEFKVLSLLSTSENGIMLLWKKGE